MISRPWAQSDSATFFGGGRFLRKATAETRAPILTQNTSNDAVPRKVVPFAKSKSNVSTPIFHKNRHFWASFRQDLEFFRLKTAVILDGSRVNDP